MNQVFLEQDPLRGLLASAIGPFGGTLLWLLVRLVSAVLYPWAWAWSQVQHWRRHRDPREHRFALCSVAAACALLVTGMAVARHDEMPMLVAHASASHPVHATAHAAEGCVGGHRSPRHC